MKILLAVLSCARDMENGFNQAIRDTWGRDVPKGAADLTFFVGDFVFSGGSWDDVVALRCPDDYKSLPFKVYQLLRYAHGEGYTHVFKCDTDTYVRPREMLGFRGGGEPPSWYTHDYVGAFNGHPPGCYAPASHYRRADGSRIYTWCSGGSGYWLSRRAIEVVLGNPPDGYREVCPNLKYGCEDLWIGQLLGPEIKAGRLKAYSDPGYNKSWQPDYHVDFTAHFCAEGMNRKFEVDWMFKHHAVNHIRPRVNHPEEHEI